jgi:hypothetical protein
METLKYQIKTDAKIDELSRKIEALSQNQDRIPNIGRMDAISATLSGEQSVSSSRSTNTIPISGKFLAKVMPAMEFTLIDNNGIFDLHVFDAGTTYSTYSDAKI